MTVTYAEIADWLPPDVREAIEVSAPCSAGVVHLWDEDLIEVSQWGRGVVREDRYWRCVYCGVVTHTDPTPAAICLQRGCHTVSDKSTLCLQCGEEQSKESR